MKRVLIISPYFPPTNAVDMQRIRMSLPYFKDFNWEAEIVTVDDQFSDLGKDTLLLKSLPAGLVVHKVKAWSKKKTMQFGLGSIALRSMWFYFKKVNHLLTTQKFDLIYFSTTQFPVCVLGYFWNKRFAIPYVIDMQDPWHSDYYQDKAQKPPKYWFSYRLNKYTERLAMKRVAGFISVNQAYIEQLIGRYPYLKVVPYRVIPFGAFVADFELAKVNGISSCLPQKQDKLMITYVGAVGPIMQDALNFLFSCLQELKNNDEALYEKIEWHFIGTSYAPAGMGTSTVVPVAQKFGVADVVFEQTDRIGYFEALQTIDQANGLLIIGSDDPNYTASKIYPYVLTGKPMLAMFHSKSPAIGVLKEYDAKYVVSYNADPDRKLMVLDFIKQLANGLTAQTYNEQAIYKYSAQNMTRRQCELFDEVVKFQNK